MTHQYQKRTLITLNTGTVKQTQFSQTQNFKNVSNIKVISWFTDSLTQDAKHNLCYGHNNDSKYLLIEQMPYVLHKLGIISCTVFMTKEKKENCVSTVCLNFLQLCSPCLLLYRAPQYDTAGIYLTNNIAELLSLLLNNIQQISRVFFTLRINSEGTKHSTTTTPSDVTHTARAQLTL